MRGMFAALASALILLCGATAAEAALPEGAANFCTAEGGFGERFGATEINGQSRSRVMNSQTITLPATYAPFTQAEVTVTHLSRRVHTINAIAPYPNEEAAIEAALEFEETLEAHFPHSGLNEMEDGFAFYSSDPALPGGWKVEIVQFGSEVQFICIDRTLYQQTMEELFGRARIAEQPTPPQLVLPEAPEGNVCETPEARAAFMADFESRMNTAMSYATDSSRYLEILTRWKSQQMIDRGAWTEADSQAFAIALLQDPGFARHMETSMNTLMQLMGGLSAAFDESASETSRCRSAVATLAVARQLSESVEAHWGYLIDRYDAEATRRGAAN